MKRRVVTLLLVSIQGSVLTVVAVCCGKPHTTEEHPESDRSIETEAEAIDAALQYLSTTDLRGSELTVLDATVDQTGSWRIYIVPRGGGVIGQHVVVTVDATGHAGMAGGR
jgi:hypothetical protein